MCWMLRFLPIWRVRISMKRFWGCWKSFPQKLPTQKRMAEMGTVERQTAGLHTIRRCRIAGTAWTMTICRTRQEHPGIWRISLHPGKLCRGPESLWKKKPAVRCMIYRGSGRKNMQDIWISWSGQEKTSRRGNILEKNMYRRWDSVYRRMLI